MNYQRQSPELTTSKCKYHEPGFKMNPHTHEVFEPDVRPKICDSILQAIGKTPMVRLNKIPAAEGVQAQILAKCEFLNPSGSMKDRIALRMVSDAEKDGKLNKETKLFEPSSGNTGIALAMVCAVKGYDLTVFMSEKMSSEKQDMMTGLGAKVVRTPGEATYHDAESLYQQCRRANENTANSIVLDQYTNVGNALAHYDQTAEEILYQCEGKIDVIVIGTGTAGTITGVARKMKERIPGIKVIAADPFGSVLAMPQKLNEKKCPHDVEGIGKDFIPRSLDRSVIDEWFKIGNEWAQPMARRLVREEGLFCGSSSGAVLKVAIEYAKRENLGADKRIVCLFADNVRNYMTKFLSKEWMVEKELMQPNELVGASHPLRGLPLEKLELQRVQHHSESLTIGEALKILQESEYEALPIVKDNKIIAVVTRPKLMDYLLNKNLKSEDTVYKAWTKEFSAVDWNNADVAAVEQLLVRRNYVFVYRQSTEQLFEVFYATQKNVLKILTV